MSHERDAPDVQLIAACAGGEHSAFDDLISRHGGAVLRFLRGRAADPASVEDAWQETFLTAWSKADSFRGEGALSSWLFTIARREQGRLEQRVAPGLGAWTASPWRTWGSEQDGVR